MKAKFFFLIILFSITNYRLYCQEVKFPPPTIVDSLLDSNEDSIKISIGLNFISYCVDVLNSDTLTILPSFLEIICIDDRPLLWPNSHSPISIRKSIIDKVNNVYVLNKILSSSNDIYRKNCDAAISYNIPFCNYSYYDLCLYRLEEIKQEYELRNK